MRRLTQLVLVGCSAGAGVAGRRPGWAGARAEGDGAAAGVRLGNFIEVGNDVFMHIIATADMRYKTVENLDFEKRIRDQATEPQSDQHRPA